MVFQFLLGSPSQEEDIKPKRYNNTTLDQNRLRTAKARATIQLNKLRRRLNQQHSVAQDASAASTILNDGKSSDPSYVGRLQNSFLTRNFLHAQYQEGTYKNNPFTFEQDRARSVVALIKGIVATLQSFFGESESSKIFHCLNCHTIDDTNTRMRGPNAASDPCTVFTIMNSVQTVHARRDLAKQKLRPRHHAMSKNSPKGHSCQKSHALATEKSARATPSLLRLPPSKIQKSIILEGPNLCKNKPAEPRKVEYTSIRCTQRS